MCSTGGVPGTRGASQGLAASKRLFVAVELEGADKDSISEAVQQFRRVPPASELENALKWVEPRNYHITLCFLGQTPVDRIPLLAEALDREMCALGAQPFPLAAGNLGAYPRCNHWWVTFGV